MIRSSLPDIFRFALRLAPTRAHPPPTQPRATTCRLAHRPKRRPTAHLGWGGYSKCSGTGWLGGCGGPLWVPGRLSRRLNGHSVGQLKMCQGERGWGAVPQNVVARGGWVDVGGPCVAESLGDSQPGLSTRRSMHGCLNNCHGEKGVGPCWSLCSRLWGACALFQCLENKRYILLARRPVDECRADGGFSSEEGGREQYPSILLERLEELVTLSCIGTTQGETDDIETNRR